MNTSKNETPDTGKSGSQNRYVSAEQLIAKMKIAFSNAKQPEILSHLATVGITEPMLDGYLNEITNLELLSQKQKQEYGEQYAQTDVFNLKRTEIENTYRRHRNLMKIATEGDRQAHTTLGTDEKIKRAYPAWYQQVSNFYAQILANPAFKAKAATVNIDDAAIAAQQTALQEVSALKGSQTKELGEAQKATEARDAALDLLYPKYTRLISFAKMLFPDDQTLEKLGVKVKSAE